MSSTEGLPYLEYCKGKTFLASKASEQTEANSMMKVKLETGDKDGKNGPMLGSDKWSQGLKTKGFQEGEPLGPEQIVLNDDIGLHHKMLAKEKFAGGWKAAYWQYGQMTKYGHLILAGIVENFQKWAKSQPCRDEVAGVEDGRLFAYLEHQEGDTSAGQGYIVALSPSAERASATIEEGVGYMIFSDGAVYHGELSKGKRHGHGSYLFANGESYGGQWHNDNKHGQGTYTYFDGEKYVGEWQDDKMHGQGSYTYPSGAKYVGEWQDGQKHGQGCYTFPSGNSWAGPFVRSKMHGVGLKTLTDGTTVEEEYVNGVLKQ